LYSSQKRTDRLVYSSKKGQIDLCIHPKKDSTRYKHKTDYVFTTYITVID